MSLQPTPPSLSGRSDGRAEESNVRARESRKAGAAGSGGWGTPFFCHSEHGKHGFRVSHLGALLKLSIIDEFISGISTQA